MPLEHALVRDLTVHVLEYEQQIEDQKPSRWAWITNLEMTWHNGLTLAQAGRCRWTIENEEFSTQKHGGYGLEHVWSHDIQAQKHFYLLMQIAHLLNELVEKGSLLREALAGWILSLKATTRDLLAEMKKETLAWTQYTPIPAGASRFTLSPVEFQWSLTLTSP